MTQVHGKDGKFVKCDRKEHVSLRIPVELRDRLKLLPNMSKYIEAVLLERMGELMASPDPDWDYYNEWDEILDVLIFAGNALKTIQQCEERCEMGDNAMELLKKNILKKYDDRT